MIDSHCHLHDLADPTAAWQAALAADVSGAISIGTDVNTSARALELAATLGEGVWASVGLHPHDAARTGEEGIGGIEALVARHRGDPNFVAVGECGLDYYYDRSPRDIQREVFAAHIALAKASGRTLVIHTRDAWEDTFDILSAQDLPDRVVFHCFTGGVDEARRCLEIGAWVSFSGIVTFPSATDVRAAAAYCPEDRIIVETDSPFLAPVPHRGRPNEPAFVAVVAAAVAAERGADQDQLAARLHSNTVAAFSLG